MGGSGGPRPPYKKYVVSLESLRKLKTNVESMRKAVEKALENSLGKPGGRLSLQTLLKNICLYMC